MRPERKYERQRPVGFREARVCACGDHGFVGLTRGLVSFVDSEDVDWLKNWHWSAKRNAHTTYARRVYNDDGVFRTFQMHRAIMRVCEQMVDHVDGDGLNNRRSNLRACTPRQNGFNKKTATGTTGVSVRGRGFAVHCGPCHFAAFSRFEDAARFRDAISYSMSDGFAPTFSGICPGEAVREPARVAYLVDGVEFASIPDAAAYRKVSMQRIGQLLRTGRDGFGYVVRSSLGEADREILARDFVLLPPTDHPRLAAPQSKQWEAG